MSTIYGCASCIYSVTDLKEIKMTRKINLNWRSEINVFESFGRTPLKQDNKMTILREAVVICPIRQPESLVSINLTTG